MRDLIKDILNNPYIIQLLDIEDYDAFWYEVSLILEDNNELYNRLLEIFKQAELDLNKLEESRKADTKIMLSEVISDRTLPAAVSEIFDSMLTFGYTRDELYQILVEAFNDDLFPDYKLKVIGYKLMVVQK